MSSPVGFGSPVSNVTDFTVGESKEKVSQAKVEEVEVSKPSLQDEFDTLIRRYVGTLHATEGCGTRAQSFIDTAYAKLTQFASEHPEFKAQLPKKVKCSADDIEGFSTGLHRIMNW